MAQKSELARLDDLVGSTESALTEVQAWDGADRLGRAERLLERQHSLANVVAERRRTVAGALSAVTEADVVASLEAESARLAADLAVAEAAYLALAPERETLERLQAELGSDEEAFDAQAVAGREAGTLWAEPPETAGDSAPLDARSARQEHDATLARLSKARESVARLAERLASFDRTRSEHEQRLAELAATIEVAASRARAPAGRARESRNGRAGSCRERAAGRVSRPRGAGSFPRTGGPGRGSAGGPRRDPGPGGAREAGRAAGGARHAGGSRRCRRGLREGLRGSCRGRPRHRRGRRRPRGARGVGTTARRRPAWRRAAHGVRLDRPATAARFADPGGPSCCATT